MAELGRLFTGGRWSGPRSGAAFTRRCPLDHCDLGPYAEAGEGDVEDAVEAAAGAAASWAATSAAGRATALHAVASVLEQHAGELAETITHEEGKRLGEAHGEVAYAVSLLRYFAGSILRSEGSVVPGSDPRALNLYRRRPLGPVGVVTPWNFPLLVPFRKLAPALAFGNTVVWKAAEDAPATALLVVELIAAAGALPAGVLNLLTGGAATGAALVRHRGLRAVSFTGSTAVGRLVQRGAVDRDEPIRVQTEMGGKNVLLVAGDADPAFAVDVALDGAMKGSGQRCTATGLVLVHASRLEAFLELAAKRVGLLRVGAGSDPETEVTPLVSRRQLERARAILESSRRAGLATVAEGVVPASPGWYLAPTLATGAAPEMAVWQEETFGPVLAVTGFDDEDEAIATANRLRYGLSAAIVTPDLSRALRFVDRLRAAVVKVNQETGSSEPNFPFGGWKASGYGPMEQGEAAVHFFTEEQTVHVVPAPPAT